MNLQSVEQVFLDCLHSMVGKLFLGVLAFGLVLLLLTFLPEIIALIIVAVVVFLGLHYFSKKV